MGDTVNDSRTMQLWPDEMKSLSLFGNTFDEPIDQVLWPTPLHRLAFGKLDDFGNFNQSMARCLGRRRHYRGYTYL